MALRDAIDPYEMLIRARLAKMRDGATAGAAVGERPPTRLGSVAGGQVRPPAGVSAGAGVGEYNDRLGRYLTAVSPLAPYAQKPAKDDRGLLRYLMDRSGNAPMAKGWR